MFYSPGQVTDILGIPPSTLRHYAKLFKVYLSSQDGRKQRLYTEKDLLIFSQIKDFSAANIPLDQIGQRLVVVEQDSPRITDSALALIPSVAGEIKAAQDAARNALAKLESIQQASQDQAEQLSQLTAQLAKLHQWAALPWYKRLFTRPPTS